MVHRRNLEEISEGLSETIYGCPTILIATLLLTSGKFPV